MCRVSTDGEEQLQSFQSQKEYYQEKISQNKDWVMVEIYADEAITGTRTEKRDGFLKMKANAKAFIPLERYGDEGELDTTALFLASPASTYTTGVIFFLLMADICICNTRQIYTIYI